MHRSIIMRYVVEHGKKNVSDIKSDLARVDQEQRWDGLVQGPLIIAFHSTITISDLP